MSNLSENAAILLHTFHDELGWSYEDLAALVGVTRPMIMKYIYHPEQMTIGEYDFLVTRAQNAINVVADITKNEEATNDN